VWAIDFQADQTADGRPLRLINVIDEHTRQALWRSEAGWV
jgi:putative transposase